ncbi:MAG: hypothetical protein Q4F08_12065 [Rikenellaceae bacterium]|nr:hypothetical protein [Rikenellaceae bacterium]
MTYADYEFYTGVYGGKAIPAQDWPALAMGASAYIDLLTFGRLAQGAQADDAVRLAVCAVAEAQARWAQAEDGGAVKSESVDGYSVAYQDADARARQLDSQRLAAADLYLRRGHPLRYAGVV